MNKSNPLNKLISQASVNSNSQISALVNAKKNNINNEKSQSVNLALDINIELIDTNPFQPRKEFDEDKIKELAESIKLVGQIEPIVVRESEINVGRYEIIAGERRLRAIKILGFSDICAVVKSADDKNMRIMALAENLDRENLSDYEAGLAIGSVRNDFYNNKELADYLGKTKKDIDRLIAFNYFPKCIKNRLDKNPKIISKSISQSIKAFLESGKFNENEHAKYVENALDNLESGKLIQSKFVGYIENLINKSSDPHHVNTIERSYSLNGKKIGEFIYDKNKLSIKLKNSKLDENVAEEIYLIIEDKLNNI